ncbi:hypothetical protein ACQQ2N_11125 [Dokdonella sp. MW10]|uniref:hypothetical protein n=1 Tax=Dokdonella sp. MW10 TaxID=2992926 RepID=UPI003F7FF539
MKRRLHVIAMVLFLLVAAFDLVLWGGVPSIPDAGEKIRRSANAEAPVAATYILLGSWVDNTVPSLGRWGTETMTEALGPLLPRIAEEPAVAMDLILNTSQGRLHGWVKTAYWAAPVLLVITALLWWRRPKKISLMRR